MRRKWQQPTNSQERSLDSFNLSKVVGDLHGTTFFQHQQTDGKLIPTDRFTLIREAHILMKAYGLGSCRSFTEFVEMVNQEDPVLINMMLSLITEDNRVESGFKPAELSIDMETIEEGFSVVNNSSISSQVGTASKDKLTPLMVTLGLDYEEIQKKRAEKGEIISNDDFSDITDEALNRPDFNLKEALARLQRAKDNSVNIRISPFEIARKKLFEERLRRRKLSGTDRPT